MKRFSALLVLIGLTACGVNSTPTNMTARHCTSNVHCKTDESCLTWREDLPGAFHQQGGEVTQTYHQYRDGICVSDN